MNNAYVQELKTSTNDIPEFDFIKDNEEDVFNSMFDHYEYSNVDSPEDSDSNTALDILKRFDDKEVGILVKFFEKYKDDNENSLSKVKRRRFNKDEDDKLKSIVQEQIDMKMNEDEQSIDDKMNFDLSKLNWSKIAAIMGNGFTTRQCKERYTKYLNPELSSLPWTKSEDDLLLSLCKEYGPKWSIIAKKFPKRTDINITNRWVTLIRRSEKQKVFSSSETK